MNYMALGAILTLKEFDATELARFSGLKLSTVYSIVRRHSGLLEEIGKKKTGKPGGKLIRYRVKPDRIAELEKTLDDFSARLNIRRKSRSDPNAEASSPQLPAAILSAERALLKRFPEATTETDKANLLRIAKIALPETGEAIDAEPPFVQLHLRLLVPLV